MLSSSNLKILSVGLVMLLSVLIIPAAHATIQGDFSVERPKIDVSTVSIHIERPNVEVSDRLPSTDINARIASISRPKVEIDPRICEYIPGCCTDEDDDPANNETNDPTNETNTTNTTLCTPYVVEGCKICSSLGTVWISENARCPIGQTCQAGVCIGGSSNQTNQTNTTLCTPLAVNGCKVCSTDGMNWTDDSTKCASNQTCQSGTCVNNPTNETNTTNTTLCTPYAIDVCKVCSSNGMAWNDDSSKCTGGQTCQSGVCVATQICTPGNISGCKVCSTDGLSWSDDSSKCTGGQTCQSGVCVATQICTPGATDGCKVCSTDGLSWSDDNNQCNADQTCQSGTCVNNPTNETNTTNTTLCTAGALNGCSVCSLDGMNWTDNSSKCTSAQKCQAGVCVARKVIIIRDDDAQGYWTESLFENVTTTLMQSGIAQTIGLIPYGSYGNGSYESFSTDEYLKAFLLSIANNPLVEIALHGYAHEDHEFLNMNLTEANTKISAGKQHIQTEIGVTTTTFIPPFHEYNNNTLQACIDNGYTVFSSGAYENPYSWTEHPTGLLHVPATVDFYNWDTNTTRTTSQITSDCQTSLDAYNVCVILIHPQELGVATTDYTTVDPAQYNTLTEVITWIKAQESQGAELMTLEQYNSIN